MNDVLPDEVRYWRNIETVSKRIFESYGFLEIRTPILEETQLFSRGIGEDTQVVQKEMYTFEDKGGDRVTMRPEATAGVVRAYLEHSLYAQDAVSKLYSLGPMFRYERPQKGRLRQFHQIDVEILGVDTPYADAEVVIMLDRLVRALGIQDYQLEVNTLGTLEERKPYLNKLVQYLSNVESSFCEDCQVRLKKNPQRIFDCKNKHCQSLCDRAPLLINDMSSDSLNHFSSFKKYLDEAGVVYQENPRIVRGLDYYEKTAFEFSSSQLGSQSAFAGGGRYNRLVQELGGPDTPGVGFAIGCERLVLLLKEADKKKQPETKFDGIYFAAMSDAGFEKCHTLMQKLRDVSVKSDMDYTLKSLKAQLRRANKLHYKSVAILGEEELLKGVVTLKSFETGEQKEITFDDLVKHVDEPGQKLVP